MKALPALPLLLLLALPAAASGPAAGIPAAKEAAELRLEGAQLVEIEGFAGTDGDIPCSRSSYSNSWHYKFYSAGEWLLVNACGPNFLNAAKDAPYSTAGLPVKRLPASFAAPAQVLKKLADDGVFIPVPNQFDRDVLMNIRLLPAAGGRPAGCYWSVSQGKVKALADCAAEKTWKPGGPAGGGKAAAPGPAVKGKDPAGRYVQLALDTIPRKNPGARLMLIESLVDRTGSARCIDAKDGWSYVFVTLATNSSSAFAGCQGKTAADYVLFDGGNTGALENLNPISPPFKDSDFALSQVPKKGCVGSYSTISMKLQNFKDGSAPVAGHNLVWTIDCGSQRHLVDAQTGSYLGPGQKTFGKARKYEKTTGTGLKKE